MRHISFEQTMADHRPQWLGSNHHTPWVLVYNDSIHHECLWLLQNATLNVVARAWNLNICCRPEFHSLIPRMDWSIPRTDWWTTAIQMSHYAIMQLNVYMYWIANGDWQTAYICTCEWMSANVYTRMWAILLACACMLLCRFACLHVYVAASWIHDCMCIVFVHGCLHVCHHMCVKHCFHNENIHKTITFAFNRISKSRTTCKHQNNTSNTHTHIDTYMHSHTHI